MMVTLTWKETSLEGSQVAFRHLTLLQKTYLPKLIET